MIDREIGGYLAFERFIGKPYHADAVALNSARNALSYVIITRRIRRLIIPYYLCECIKDICGQHSVEIQYYHIKKNLLPEIDDIYFDEDTALYLVNYFGQISDKFINELRVKTSILIVDNVQSFFQMPVEGIDTLYTCRKYFGVPDGAYLYTNRKLTYELSIDSSCERVQYLIGRQEYSGERYYPYYQENELLIDTLPLKRMSAFTSNMLNGLDYNYIQNRRLENIGVLHKFLYSINELNVSMSHCTFAYPLLINNGVTIRKELTKKKIFVPTLWPNVLSLPVDWKEHRLAEDLLPLPCDQRYNADDMVYVAETILEIAQNAA